MKRINIDRTKCISCLTCVSACKVSHNGRVACNRVVISSKQLSTPLFCRHCDLPECTYACPTGAMSQDLQTGYVNYDEKRCAACYMCVMSCSYGVLRADAQDPEIIMKCDMCKQHVPAEPQCVLNCPMKAITLEEQKEVV